MRMALATLLDGACYHMFDVFRGSQRDWDHWDQALNDIDKEEKTLTDQVNYIKVYLELNISLIQD